MTRGPIVLLAGGPYQFPIIEAARRRGLRTVVFDGSPTAPALRLADEGRVVDLTDLEALRAAACAVQPSAVAAIVSEVAVTGVAHIAAALGLPGLPPPVAEACTDKFVMRQRFEAAGLPVPRFARAESAEEAAAQARRLGYPVVVKPVDNAGSRGVRRVDRAEELGEAFSLAQSQSRKRVVIIESFLEGVECTVETFSSRGRTEILGMSEKVHLPFPVCVSIDLTYPPSFAAATCEAIADAAKAAIRAVGLTDGPGHVEVMLTAGGPVVVELAARGGGYRIFSDILPAISGVDPVECVLDVALGVEPSIVPTRRRAAVLRFFNPPQHGTLKAVSGVERARMVDGILDVTIEQQVGTPFHGITRDGERPGYLIAIADDRAGVLNSANTAEALVTFEFQSA